MERLNEKLVREWHESAGEKVRAERRFSLGAIQDFAEWVLARAALEAARELREENDNLKHDVTRQMTDDPLAQPLVEFDVLPELRYLGERHNDLGQGLLGG